MRRHSSCRWCPGHGRSTPVGLCMECGVSYCGKHGGWSGERWLCSRCLRREKREE